MKVIILAAGYATRLYPLTRDKPKALLPIGSKPLLDHIFDKILAIHEVKEIILVTNSRFFGNFSDWAKGKTKEPALHIVDDGTTDNDNRLGAMGDLSFALKARNVHDDIMVLASDNLFDAGFEPFIRFAKTKPGVTVGAFDIVDKTIASEKYGIFEFDKEGKVSGFEEKPEKPKTPFVSMGIYYFPKKTLSFLDEYLSGMGKGDAPGYYVNWLLKNKELFAFIFKGRWYDIGSIEQLNQATREY